MAATPKPIRKKMRKEQEEHRHPNHESTKVAFEGLSKGERKKKSNAHVKHANKLNVYESPKHEKNRKHSKEDLKEAAMHMEKHMR